MFSKKGTEIVQVFTVDLTWCSTEEDKRKIKLFKRCLKYLFLVPKNKWHYPLIIYFFFYAAVARWPPVGTFFYQEPYSSTGPCSSRAQGKPKIHFTDQPMAHGGFKWLKTAKNKFVISRVSPYKLLQIDIISISGYLGFKFKIC